LDFRDFKGFYLRNLEKPRLFEAGFQRCLKVMLVGTERFETDQFASVIARMLIYD